MEPMFPKSMTHNSMGKKKTTSMFAEVCRQGDVPFMSLRPQKENGHVSLRDLFIKLTVDDPTETVFAETVFGDYDFWLNLLKCKWMDDYIDNWRTIADAKRKAKAFEAIISEVETRGRSCFTAAKFLIDEPWKEKTTKANKQKEKSTKMAYNEIADDVKRLKELDLLQ